MVKRPRKKEFSSAASFQPALAEASVLFQGCVPPGALVAHPAHCRLIFWIYGPVLHGGWVWDDTWYITTNPLLRTETGLLKIWFNPEAGSSITRFMRRSCGFLWQFSGSDTLAYHLTTVLLHLLNALLVWRLLAKFGLRYAWLGGLILPSIRRRSNRSPGFRR